MENKEVQVTQKEVSTLSIKYQLGTKRNRIRFISRVAMFSALATVFYIWLKFPLPIFPSFLEVNFSNLFIIIGSFITGPIGGALICLIRFGIKCAVGTSTAFVGELTDLLLSLAICMPCSIIYLKNHTRKGGLIGISFSLLSWVISSVLINWFISLPFYIDFFFGGSIDVIVGILSKTIKGVTNDNYMLYYLTMGVLPFNLLVGFVNCLLATVVYKKISQLLNRIGI